MRSDLPTGTVTFLFTDVEGSTKLLHELGAEGYAEALAEHRQVIREACTRHDGVEVDTQGDAFFAFPTAPGAIAAAGEMTETLAAGPIQVRAGLHTGTPLLTDEGYVGGDVHRAARIAAAGYGGQVLVSASTAQLIEVELADLGEHRFKDLGAPERVYQLGDREFPALKSLYRTNLPVPSTPFLGRERELVEVVGLLAGTRLLTLTGPGGTGKTRLALQAAGIASDGYPDGVWWVPLGSLREPTLVLESAAQVVGSTNSLAEHIADKAMMFLFDNFEQVVATAPELPSLLAACPNLTLLVTSRELLRVQGEIEYRVPSLTTPEAVDLFCARSRLEADETIAELCRHLDDLPLAVELAAARTSVLSPRQILERLSKRLDLLKGGRDADPRQATLRATIDWSYELLSEDERRLFAWLAVFRDGCTLEAAEEVAGADLDTLQSLVEKSLLRFTNERYWMLETIREYATEALVATSHAEEAARRHAEHYLRLALEAEPELRTAAQSTWLDRLDEEHDNLRAALDWSMETAHWELGFRIAHSLRRFWEVRGHFQEGKRYLSSLEAVDLPPELRALALGDLVFFTMQLDELDQTERFTHERRRLCLELGDEEGANRALQNLGMLAELRGDLDSAKALFEEVVAFGRQHSYDVGVPLGNLAILAWKQCAFTDAEALFEEALAEFEARGDDVQVAYISTNLASVRLYQDRRDQALAPLRRAVLLYRELRSPGGLAYAFEAAALASADAESAPGLLGKADELRAETGETLQPEPHGPRAHVVGIATKALGQEAFDAAYAEGRAMSLDDAITLALSVID